MSKVVLIVEDDPRNLRLFHDLLQVSGYRPVIATDGRQGVELARTVKPHLILMDIQLPGIDGLEATRLLKGDPATQDIPVIVVTAHAMAEDREKVVQAGADACMSKPIDTRVFLQKVAELTGGPGSCR